MELKRQIEIADTELFYLLELGPDRRTFQQHVRIVELCDYLFWARSSMFALKDAAQATIH